MAAIDDFEVSESNRLDLGHFNIKDVVLHGWFTVREPSNMNLDPYEIMVTSPTCVLVIYKYPETHTKEIKAVDPTGFRRWELAEEVAKYHLEMADPDEDPEDMFSVARGTIDGGRNVHVDLASSPVRVYSDLDY